MGADERFRAVLMTSWAFVLGVVPLVFATGAGAASRIAIGVPVCVGIFFNIFLGRAIIPSLYSAFEHMREFFSRSKTVD